ncbi:MAG TPA: ISAzo13 family transposase, partial [Chloroflexota bacterium]
LISATTTQRGLHVAAALDTGTYPLGVEVSDDEFAAIPIRPHEFHGEWHYTIDPRPSPVENV